MTYAAALISGRLAGYRAGYDGKPRLNMLDIPVPEDIPVPRADAYVKGWDIGWRLGDSVRELEGTERQNGSFWGF